MDSYPDFLNRIKNNYTNKRKNILCCIQYLRTFYKDDKILEYISYNADYGHYRNKLQENAIINYYSWHKFSLYDQRLLEVLFRRRIPKGCLHSFANLTKDVDYKWSHLAYICKLAYCTHNSLNWELSETSINLAQSIYKEYDWKACPILADSLEDDGVTDYYVLEELREPLTVKFRGYWLIDEIKSKEIKI